MRKYTTRQVAGGGLSLIESLRVEDRMNGVDRCAREFGKENGPEQQEAHRTAWRVGMG